MKPIRRVHVFAADAPHVGTRAAEPSRFAGRELPWPLERALARTSGWLVDHQQDDGHWVAELEGDTILESEYILLLAFLDQQQSELRAKRPSSSSTRSVPREAGPSIRAATSIPA